MNRQHLQRFIPLTLIALLALLVRLLTIPTVFGTSPLRFLGGDPYYHMRLISYCAENFPQFLSTDSYVNYPIGYTIGWPPLFDQIVAGCAVVLGFGSPSQGLVELVGALFPAIVGVCTVVVVYVLTKLVFNREGVALAAAGLLALLPAHITFSQVGFIDHHVWEIFILSLILLAVVVGLKHPRRCLEAGAACGVLFAVAVYSFPSAPIVIGTVALLFVLLFLFCQGTGKDTTGLFLVSGGGFLLSGLLTLCGNAVFFEISSFARKLSLFQPAFLFALFGVMVILFVFARLVGSRPWYFYFGPVVVLGLLSYLFQDMIPGIPSVVRQGFSYLSGGGSLSVIMEAESFFIGRTEGFELSMMYTYFGFVLLFALAGLVVYLYRARSGADETAILLGGLLIAGCILAGFQSRFVTFLGIPAAIWAGYLLVVCLEWTGVWQVVCERLKRMCNGDLGAADNTHDQGRKSPSSKSRSKKSRNTMASPSSRSSLSAVSVLAACVICVLVIGPVAVNAFSGVSTGGTPDDDWWGAYLFLKSETPVTSYYDNPVENPEYSVLSFWDKGNQVLYVGERPVVTNNFQVGISDCYKFYLSDDVNASLAVLDKRKVTYVITESGMVGYSTMYHYLTTLVNDPALKGMTLADVPQERLKDALMDSTYFKLHYLDGEGLPQFTLVYASDSIVDRENEVKVYRYDG